MATKPYRRQTWVSPRQMFHVSPTQGIGSFAQGAIRQGEVVEIVGGTVMTDTMLHAFMQTTPRFNAIQIAEDKHLVELPEVTQQRTGGSLNHSCDSNLWMADEVTLVARRDIVVGEEITVDYALFTVQPAWVLDQSCHCGTDVCRRTVTGNDWTRLDVQRRYHLHFSPFINARIEQQHKKTRKNLPYTV